MRLNRLSLVSLAAAAAVVGATTAQERTPDATMAGTHLHATAKAAAAARLGVPESRLRVLNTAHSAGRAGEPPGHVVKVLDPPTGATHIVRFGQDGVPEGRPRAGARQRPTRIDPILERELQAAGADATLRVAIWLRDEDRASTERPAPAAARRLRSATERRAFLEVAKERRARRVAALASPVVQRLRARDVSARVAGASPVVFGTIPARLAAEIAAWPEVDGVFADVVNEPELAVARQATKAHIVERRGITGQGVRVAQVEARAGWVSAANPYLAGVFQDAFGVCPGGDDPETLENENEHVTRVAGIIRSHHGEVRGIAPGVSLWAGGSCSGASSELQEATQRALDWGARVVNLSWGLNAVVTRPGLNDRFYDDVALNQHVLVVKSAGNRAASVCGATDGYVTSPGLGFNVLTVGAMDDLGTVGIVGNARNDPKDDRVSDKMDVCSSYVDPDSTHGDREKPELVAPGTRIQTTTISPPWVNDLDESQPGPSGTSFSAPIVTAAAALLMQRDPALELWPEAVRAILMATALQNLEGPTRSSDRDGAGAVSLEKADDTARRRVTLDGRLIADWDGLALTCDSTTPTGQIFTTTLPLVAGRRVRAAIAWNSDPNYARYELEPSADLDVQLLGPSGAIVAASSSFDNTYEIVDHVPGVTGTYTLRITLTRCDLSPRYVGWAWWRGQ